MMRPVRLLCLLILVLLPAPLVRSVAVRPAVHTRTRPVRISCGMSDRSIDGNLQGRLQVCPLTAVASIA